MFVSRVSCWIATVMLICGLILPGYSQEKQTGTLLKNPSVMPRKGWSDPLNTQFVLEVTYQGKERPDKITLKLSGSGGDVAKPAPTLSDEQVRGAQPIQWTLSSLAPSTYRVEFDALTRSGNSKISGGEFVVRSFWLHVGLFVFFTILIIAGCIWLYSWWLYRLRVKTVPATALTIISGVVLIAATLFWLLVEVPVIVWVILMVILALAWLFLFPQRLPPVQTTVRTK